MKFIRKPTERTSQSVDMNIRSSSNGGTGSIELLNMNKNPSPSKDYRPPILTTSRNIDIDLSRSVKLSEPVFLENDSVNSESMDSGIGGPIVYKSSEKTVLPVLDFYNTGVLDMDAGLV